MALTRIVGFVQWSRRETGPDPRKTGLHPDFWYPVACSKRLKRGKAIGVCVAGDPATAETTPFPEVPSHGDFRYQTRYPDREVACHYAFMHENLMDMNHSSFSAISWTASGRCSWISGKGTTESRWTTPSAARLEGGTSARASSSAGQAARAAAPSTTS